MPSVSNEEILLPPLIQDDAECGISFEKPDCRISCGHYFCRAEITRWFEQQKNERKKMTCPTCRAEITCPTCRAEIINVIPDVAKRRINDNFSFEEPD